jgi:hypothetical protein
MRAGLYVPVAHGPTFWITVERITIKGHYYKSQTRASMFNDSVYFPISQDGLHSILNVDMVHTIW